MVKLINIPGIVTVNLLLRLDRLKCGKSECRGYKNDDEFTYKIQTEKCLKEVTSKEVMQVDKLPLYEEFYADLSSEDFITEFKKVAPLNGRAVVLFKATCGCPYAKIEAWSSEDSRRRHATASIEARIKSGEDAVCYICKKNYANISEIKQLPCSHFFHEECIDNAVKIDGLPLCPLCDEWDESWDESWIEGWDKNQEDDFVMV
ncbi:uncharacterized protein At5g19025-like [Apium graveolens]|uniref:uncharacterized protein At5g19025-like n=1 Tax=Apium graveolens TaxID=4045 RepID=UPI003D798E43